MIVKTASFIFLSFLLVSHCWAYQEIEVKNGGIIKGKAVLSGKMPENRVFHLILFPNLDMCAEIDTDDNLNRVLFDFKVGKDKGLKDVVIALKHVDAGKPFTDKPVEILSKNCKFSPDVNIIRQDDTFTVNNADAVMHNSQVYQSERGKIILNIPIPPEEVSQGMVHFQKKYKIMQMICGMHEFMQTWGYRVQNPYNYLTLLDGEYLIEDVPPGDYVLTAWHYLMKLRKQKIHVEENSVVTVDFDFSGDEVVRSLYETIKSGRISEEAAIPGTQRRKELDRAKKIK
ncbi:MAG: carboxypeptidase regulatory-like domain-containing protein [Nitrospinota bacterium]|nr:carboxypeptidase regulatory-like domain-containing protein [Nitrospinota bacterium]